MAALEQGAGSTARSPSVYLHAAGLARVDYAGEACRRHMLVLEMDWRFTAWERAPGENHQDNATHH